MTSVHTMAEQKMIYNLKDTLWAADAKDTLREFSSLVKSFSDEYVFIQSLNDDFKDLVYEYYLHSMAMHEVVDLAIECDSNIDFENKVYKVACHVPYAEFEELVFSECAIRVAYRVLADSVINFTDACFKHWQKVRCEQ